MQEEFKGQTRAENRRHPRVQLKLWVHYRLMRQGTVSAPLESLAEDLGTRGTAIRSDHPERVGQLLVVTLYLPLEQKRKSPAETPVYSEDESLPVEILSRVVWCKQLETREYMLGIEFLDPKPGHRNRLKSFLIDYNLDQPDTTLYT